MFFYSKKDIAISVTEEDVGVAIKLASSFRKRGISYFLYPEYYDENWGRELIDISLDRYAAKARYVLVITSRFYAETYWGNIEKVIATIVSKKKFQPYILQLRLDETPIRGFENIVYVNWDNNPDYIAELIKKKLRKRLQRILLWYLKWIIIPIIFAISITLPVYFSSQDHNENKPKTLTKNEALVDSSIERKPDKKSPKITKAKNGMRDTGRILIPGDSFIMGINSGAISEQPQHKVTINDFYISKTEVTVGQYKVYCEIKDKQLPAQPKHLYTDSCPVVNISWDEAQSYCEWMGGRLPTEAEWEYAAGAGLLNKYSGGNNASNVAVYGSSYSKPARVGHKNENTFGLFDMSGNVFEWCSDWYDVTYYSHSDSINPRGPKEGEEKVMRGGAFNSTTYELRVAYRSKEFPSTTKSNIGFRVVWDKNNH